MERRGQLDAPGRSPAWQLIAVIFCVLLMPALALADPPQAAPEVSRIQSLADQQRWREIVDELQRTPHRTAELDYYYGTALAQLGHYEEARAVLMEGYRLQPHDKRFPTELAGTAFKLRNYREAKHWLHRALEVDPRDTYANDFLATIYFLQNNLEAALKYWNRIDKPEVQKVAEEPELRVDAALLDRAFAFSPASVLHLPDLLTSKARLDRLGIFSSYKFELNARDDGKFDLIFRAVEKDGWGVNKWQALLSTFRGVFYETIYPEYFNLNGSATNVTSLIRWDAQKRRVAADVAGPLWRDPRFRYAIGLDLRNENWNIVTSFTGPAALLGALNLRREAIHAEISSFNSGRWGWSTGMQFSHRDYRNVFEGSALTPAILLSGYQLKQVGKAHALLLHVPERRFRLTGEASEEVGRIWSHPAEAFLKLQGSVEGTWFPQSEGNDYETASRLRAGKTFGQLPFDELFMLGLERDNDLWMRAHIGTRHGRKGSAPLGRNYVLFNGETNKNLYNNGLFGVRLSPFVDIGKITDPAPLGANKWLWDTGLQLKFSVLSVGLTFTYGKDLRSGANAFYLSAQR